MSSQATYSQKRAAEFLTYLLDTVDVRPALKHFNIKDKRYIARLKAKLRQTSSLADAPRSGRKPKYTEEQAQLAVRVLSEARPHPQQRGSSEHSARAASAAREGQASRLSASP